VKSYTSKFSFLFLFLAGAFISCTPDLQAPAPQPGEADFTKTIAVGGNFMAGYQDGALGMEGQRLSLPALLAEQFKQVGGGSFMQPLMPDNSGFGLHSKPWEGTFVTASELNYRTDCKGVTSLGPIKSYISVSSASPYLQGTAGNGFQNLSAPFARMQDYFNPSFGLSYSAGNPNPYYNRFASNPGSSTLYFDAKAQNASFIMIWSGMEDIYEYARYGGYNVNIASSASFSAYLDTLLSGLTANGAKGVIANIPHPSSFPFYTLISPRGLQLTQDKADSLNLLTGGLFNLQEGTNGFIIEDSNAPFGYRQMVEGEYVLLSVPTDSLKCDFLGAFTELPDKYTLDSTEVKVLEQAINDYNAVIAQKASQYGLALADMNSYLGSVKSGIMWDGVKMDATFVSGGFYSLDGFHPNQKGYAQIANEFIRVINARYGSTIPTVNCTECSGIKFP
jgi:hypothetical protein